MTEKKYSNLKISDDYFVNYVKKAYPNFYINVCDAIEKDLRGNKNGKIR
jgi:hypothetical protein